MVCPRRLFFSQFVVLMCTANCEKDSLLGQTILALEPFLFFENPCFLLVTLYTLSPQCSAMDRHFSTNMINPWPLIRGNNLHLFYRSKKLPLLLQLRVGTFLWFSNGTRSTFVIATEQFQLEDSFYNEMIMTQKQFYKYLTHFSLELGLRGQFHQSDR